MTDQVISEIASLLRPDEEQSESEEQEQAPREVEATAAAEPSPGHAGEPAEPIAAPEPVRSFNDLAERAGLDIKALYDLEVKLGGEGEPVKLGALKDAYQAGIDLDGRQASLEEQHRELQNEVLRSTKAIHQLMGDLQLSEDQVQRAALEFDQTRAREQEKLFHIMPELKDAGLRSEVYGEMGNVLAEYGVSQAEIDNIADARFVKFALDAVGWKKQLSAANPDAKRVRKTAGPTAKKPRRVVSKAKNTKLEQSITRAKQTRMKDDQVSAIAALLGGNS